MDNTNGYSGRIPFHIKEVIKLKGGNKYKEGRKKE
jgi:hypothetical protein